MPGSAQAFDQPCNTFDVHCTLPGARVMICSVKKTRFAQKLGTSDCRVVRVDIKNCAHWWLHVQSMQRSRASYQGPGSALQAASTEKPTLSHMRSISRTRRMMPIVACGPRQKSAIGRTLLLR